MSFDPVVPLFAFPALVSILTIFWKIKVKNFIVLYLVSVAVVGLYSFYFLGFFESLISLTIGLVGLFLTIFGFMGVAGSKIDPFVYKNVMIAIGLFPWFVSWKASGILIVLMAAYLLADYLFRSSTSGVIAYLRIISKGRLREKGEIYKSMLPIPIVIGSISSIAILLS